MTESFHALIDAKVTAVKPYTNDYGVNLRGAIGEITVKTNDGRKLVITAGGFDDDRYMELEEE